jgi:hypothetical protein
MDPTTKARRCHKPGGDAGRTPRDTKNLMRSRRSLSVSDKSSSCENTVSPHLTNAVIERSDLWQANAHSNRTQAARALFRTKAFGGDGKIRTLEVDIAQRGVGASIGEFGRATIMKHVAAVAELSKRANVLVNDYCPRVWIVDDDLLRISRTLIEWKDLTETADIRVLVDPTEVWDALSTTEQQPCLAEADLIRCGPDSKQPSVRQLILRLQRQARLRGLELILLAADAPESARPGQLRPT